MKHATIQPLRARGAVLLEIVLALTLFVGAAVVLTAAMNASVRAAKQLDIEAQAVNLTASTIAELQIGTESTSNAAWSRQIEMDEPPHALRALGMRRVNVLLIHRDTGYRYRVTTLLRARPPNGGVDL